MTARCCCRCCCCCIRFFVVNPSILFHLYMSRETLTPCAEASSFECRVSMPGWVRWRLLACVVQISPRMRLHRHGASEWIFDRFTHKTQFSLYVQYPAHQTYCTLDDWESGQYLEPTINLNRCKSRLSSTNNSPHQHFLTFISSSPMSLRQANPAQVWRAV